MDIPKLIKLQKQYSAKLPAVSRPLQVPFQEEIAGWIDHTLLKPEATASQIETLCQEALAYSFASVCVNPAFVPLACENLALPEGKSGVKTCTVIGFPLGATLPAAKASETAIAVDAGATAVPLSRI